MDQAAQEDQRCAEWHILPGVIALIGVARVSWMIAKVIAAPSTEEAMRLSLAEMNVPELSTAYTLHPNSCAITKTFWKWSVVCEDVPIYFYRDSRQCDPGPARTCRTVPSDHQVCVSYYWEIDLSGKPSNPTGDKGRYASIGDRCKATRSFASEREEMTKRGIAPNLVEVR